ncbi:mannosyltransferase family protein [Microbacteriaceae bacterium 4G12]
MTPTQLTAARAVTTGRRGSTDTVALRGYLVPMWALVLAAYAASRLLTTALLAAVHGLARSLGWDFASFDWVPSFARFLASWDGVHYGSIAVDGYPTELPRGDDGNVQKNPWAFLPLFPLMVRPVSAITGWDFALSGAVISTIFGAAATVALYRMLLPSVGRTSAFWGAMFFCFGPMSFVLQIAYAESVFLFFMFCSVAAMSARRYWLMIPLGVGAAFAHPGALAVSAALGLHFLFRLAGRDKAPFPHAERVAAIAAGIVITIAGFAWPLVATAVTGSRSAYFDTEMAWWRDYVGEVGFVPFTPFFLMASHYLGAFGVVMVSAVLFGAILWLSGRQVRRLGLDLHLYTISYVAYLVAVFLPQQSLFRMLLPLSPLLGLPALSATPQRRRRMLTACIALQPVAILLFWFVWPA